MKTKNTIVAVVLAVMAVVAPLSASAFTVNKNAIGCTPYLADTTVGTPVTMTVANRNIPVSQQDKITWVVPYSGTPATGTGLYFTTAFTEPGFFVVHMYYRGDFSGVCAFVVK